MRAFSTPGTGAPEGLRSGGAPLMHPRALRHGMGAEGAGGGAVYGLGFIGAAIYYIQAATGFWVGLLGLLKAIVWPAFLVYELLQLVNA